MNPTRLERLHCWLRLGHRWYFDRDDRECTRCGLRQYVAIEDENNGHKNFITITMPEWLAINKGLT